MVKQYNWLKINEILISILIIGLINLYFIFRNGLILNYPYNNSIDNINSIFKISEKEILILIIINILYFIIFSATINSKFLFDYYFHINSKYLSFEFFFILFSSILGLNFISLFNDFFNLFLAIEIYSLSIYLLLLIKFSKTNSFYSILFFIFNSIGSFLLLFAVILFFYFYGITTLDSLNQLITLNIKDNTYIFIPLFIIIISLFFKIGLAPFHFWVLRVYRILDSNLLLYLIFIPKIVYFFVLVKFLSIFLPFSHLFPSSYLFYFFLFIALLSCLIGSIGGLFHNNFNLLITYSSIFNLGFFLFGFLSYLTFSNSNTLFGVYHISEYLFIYIFNLFSLFFAYFLFNKSHFNHSSNILSSFFLHFKKFPFLSLSFIFSIFSFIGLPPFSGFFAKLNIFNTLLINSTNFTFLAIIFLFIVTLFSASLYLKFIYSIYFNQSNSNSTTKDLDKSEVFDQPFILSYFLAFFSLSLFLYPFLSFFFYPYFFFLF